MHYNPWNNIYTNNFVTTLDKGLQECGPRLSLGVAFHTPRSVKECEGINPHTPKGTPTLGVGVPMDSRIFRVRLQGSKPIDLKSSLYHWKVIKTKMFKMCSHCPFGHPKHKLWSKERLEVKLPTTKSWESTRFPCVQAACDISLKIFWQGLQLFFILHCNRRSARKVMGPQSCGSPRCGNFEEWESRDKMPFGCGPRGEVQTIL
jgi:hypothetical protein